MAIAMTFRGFNDLGRSLIPILLSMDHFLYRFCTFCEKVKKYSSRSFNIFAKRSIEFRLWPIRLAVRQFQMPR